MPVLSARSQTATTVLVLGSCVMLFGSGCDRSSQLTTRTDPPPVQVRIDTLLEEARPLKGDEVSYNPPSLEERLQLTQVADELFEALHSGRPISDERLDAFAGTGLRADRLADGKFVVLRTAGEWRGAGVYVFRTGEASPAIIQAPHGYHDRLTAEIAWSVFRDTRTRAVFINTAHRYLGTRSRKRRDIRPADMAHATDSYFYVITDRALRAAPESHVVQLHGYEDRQLRRQGVDVVLSNGTAEIDDTLREYHDRTAKYFGAEAVAMYPRDSRKFAASSNTIGRLIRITGRGHFVHVELSSALREKLAQDPSPLVSALGR